MRLMLRSATYWISGSDDSSVTAQMRAGVRGRPAGSGRDACVHVCMHACVRARVHACVHGVRAIRVYVCMGACVCARARM